MLTVFKNLDRAVRPCFGETVERDQRFEQFGQFPQRDHRRGFGGAGIVGALMRLDADLLAWFRRHRGYQTRINAILRAYMSAHAEDR